MTQEEWLKLASYMKSHYSEFKHFLANDKEMDIWRGFFFKMDFNLGKRVAEMCIFRCSYPPKLTEAVAFRDEILSEQKATSKQIYQIYREMEAYYPMSLRDEGRIEAFKTAIKAVDKSEAVNTARKIHNRVINRVEDAERRGANDLPVLSECIRECSTDGAGRSGNT